MNRRAFLQRFGIGLGAACALASLPVAVVEALSEPQAARLLACEFLRQRYLSYMRGRSAPAPEPIIRVCPGLFLAFDEELGVHQRWIPVLDRYLPDVDLSMSALMFKGFPVVEDAALTCWDETQFVPRAA